MKEKKQKFKRFFMAIFITLLIVSTMGIITYYSPHSSGTQWYADGPIFFPNESFAPATVSVKDPSIVYYDGKWHVFFTGISYDNDGVAVRSINYVSSPTLQDLNSSTRRNISVFSKNTKRTAAPQVFYFEPQGLWYLIAQAEYDGDRYIPIYLTTKNISDFTSWSSVQPLIEKFEKDKWIDFWIICDNTTAYLFYTRNHEAMYYLSTSLAEFPNNFSTPTKVKGNIKVHEASMVYKIEDKQEYWLLTEVRYRGDLREFYLSKSSSLIAEWSDSILFATGGDLDFRGGEVWTTVVSHGEFIRSGYNQRMEIPSSEHIEFLIQGTTLMNKIEYSAIPWRWGIIRNFKDV